MRRRILALLSALAIVIVAVSLVGTPAAGQEPAARAKTNAAGKTWTPPRTPDGQPDLQGVWSFATATPMERPPELAGKPFLTEQEAADYAKRVVERRNKDNRDIPAQADVAAAYNDFWWDQGTDLAKGRTSLVVDPPDGRIPPLTAEAQKKAAARAAERRLRGPSDGPEDRSLGERCILGFNSGPPVAPSAYNNHIQIFQTRDHVAILNEMVHNARIVPMDGRPHLPQTIRQWVGDSRGTWEGDTLVVETRNWRPDRTYRNTDPDTFRLIERFTRADAGTLLYEFRVNDPTTFTKPWTAQIPMARTEEKMYEYACHEGNYGMFNLLAGARAEEAAAKKR